MGCTASGTEETGQELFRLLITRLVNAQQFEQKFKNDYPAASDACRSKVMRCFADMIGLSAEYDLQPHHYVFRMLIPRLQHLFCGESGLWIIVAQVMLTTIQIIVVLNLTLIFHACVDT